MTKEIRGKMAEKNALSIGGAKHFAVGKRCGKIGVIRGIGLFFEKFFKIKK